MKQLCVLEIPGLTAALVRRHATNLQALGAAGQFDVLEPDLPAVTMTGHASLTTGLRPSAHGLVGNGWFDRAGNRVRFWEQSERLVSGRRVWEEGKSRDERFTALKYFWWPGMASTADCYGNVRPAYCADGRKLPDVYFNQPGLAAEVQERFGTFPLFRFWGPAASLESTRWIAETTKFLFDRQQPTLTLAYLPHLDYRQQSHGPGHESIGSAVEELDGVAADLIEHVRSRGAEVLVVSGYQINAVDQPIYLNRLFRRQGWLQVIHNATGELIDFGTSRVFAVADHQVAHVYVMVPAMVEEVGGLLRETPGIAAVLDEEGKRAAGLDHSRSGDLIALSDDRSWFAYYYWLDDRHAPDFARTVAIHDKPGYDPCELLLNPAIRFPRWKIAGKLLRKALGMRYLMDLIPLDAALVRGSHGLPPRNDDDAPVLLSSVAQGPASGRVPMNQVKDQMLRMIFDAPS